MAGDRWYTEIFLKFIAGGFAEGIKPNGDDINDMSRVKQSGGGEGEGGGGASSQMSTYPALLLAIEGSPIGQSFSCGSVEAKQNLKQIDFIFSLIKLEQQQKNQPIFFMLKPQN